MELSSRRAAGNEVVECVDNDETAEVISQLVNAKTLVLLTSTEGIYLDRDDPSTLVTLITGNTLADVQLQTTRLMEHCVGASRPGANGARAKLAYALRAAEHGTTVIIGHARHHIMDLVKGNVPCTRLGVGLS